MAAKLTADPDTRIIEITEAPVDGFQSLDVQEDIYEPLKDDWFSDGTLQSSKFPFRTFGDPKTATTQIGPYVFFDNLNGWRFQPFDTDHTLVINGNIVGESSVEGENVPLFIGRAGRQITILSEQSAQALSIGGNALSATTPLEGSLTWEESQRIILSALAGKLSGAATTNVKIRDQADTKDRIDATVDSSGNRTAVTVDGS